MEKLAIMATAIFAVAIPPFTMTVGEQITATQSAVSATAVSSSAVKPTENHYKSKKSGKKIKKITVKKKNSEKFKITAYCPCHECSGKYGRQTATGHTATSGHTIAVDQTVIPYGTHVKINGVEYIAEDCGGAVKGNTIDIFFDTHEETEQFGVKYLEVEVMK